MVLMLQGLEMMRYKNLVASRQLSNSGSFLERQPSLRASGKAAFGTWMATVVNGLQ